MTTNGPERNSLVAFRPAQSADSWGMPGCFFLTQGSPLERVWDFGRGGLRTDRFKRIQGDRPGNTVGLAFRFLSLFLTNERSVRDGALGQGGRP